jgi:redox-sensitive bicupin YhaK (pirin superfamily)
MTIPSLQIWVSELTPHSNMEIITLPLSGSLKHRDSMGHEAIITSGEVQVMSAGTGIEHSEHNASKTEPLNLLQIWVFADKDGHTPRYDQKTLPIEKMQNQLYTFLEPHGGENTVTIHQNAYFSLGEWGKDDKLNYPFFDKKNGVYAFLIAGEAEVAGQTLNEKDAGRRYEH